MSSPAWEAASWSRAAKGKAPVFVEAHTRFPRIPIPMTSPPTRHPAQPLGARLGGMVALVVAVASCSAAGLPPHTATAAHADDASPETIAAGGEEKGSSSAQAAPLKKVAATTAQERPSVRPLTGVKLRNVAHDGEAP